MMFKISTALLLVTMMVEEAPFLLKSSSPSLPMTASAFAAFSSTKSLKQRANAHLLSTLTPLSSSKKEEEEEGYQVEISYEGRKTTLNVKPDEPILSAMERSHVSKTLCLPDIPHECRRGNCLTCTGIHAPNSNVSNLVSEDNGLSPHLSKKTFENKKGEEGGYVLTCSSFVVGDGVKLELGRNDDIWTEVYSDRLMGDDMERIGMEARAKLLRRVAEQNVQKWAKETEKALRQSGR